MIIHFANQSQTCQLLKILKNIFFQSFHEKKLWKVVQSIPCWTDIENPYRLSRESYIYIIYMSSSWHNILTISPRCESEFTRWAIIEDLSIRRRLRTFLISWGQVGIVLKWHTLVPCLQPRNTQWHEIKGAGETVETPRVPTSPQGEHSLAESRHDHWWRLPDVYVGAKNSTGFPNTCWKN